MKRKSLLIQLTITAGVFALFNIAVLRMSHNVSWRACVRHVSTAPPFAVLGIGNSLMEAGLDADAFNEASKRFAGAPVALNAGLGATEPVEHLMLLRRATQHQNRYGTLVYGFFDFQLTELKPAELMGNRAVSAYLEPAIAARYYTSSPVENLAFRMTHYIPYLTERSQIWERVEKLRRKLGEVGMPHAQENQFGRSDDFRLLEAGSSQEFDRDCQVSVRDNIPLSAPVQEILQYGAEHADRVVFVCMPMSPFHRSHYYSSASWPLYREHLRALVKSSHAEFIDASEWVLPQSDFNDNLHLNATGAALFSKHLAQTLEETKKK